MLRFSFVLFSFVPETMGLLRAGYLSGAAPGPRNQMCCEEDFLGHPAAAQAVLQAAASHLSPENQALQEPGDSDQLHLQRAVSLQFSTLSGAQSLYLNPNRLPFSRLMVKGTLSIITVT